MNPVVALNAGAKASWLRAHLNELRTRCTQANPSVHVHGRPQPRGDSMALAVGTQQVTMPILGLLSSA